MDLSFSTIQPEVMIIFAAFFVINLLLFFMNLVNSRKIKKLKAKYNRFMNGSGDRNLEEIIDKCLDEVNRISARSKEIDLQFNTLERNLMNCIQKVGIVRYNAFENVGSDLSFSIALLDNNDDGVILSGIYSRESSSSYAKPVIGGNSKYTLSAEEIQALDIARKIHREKATLGK
ncbi:MAG TPA: DUF4446 family protein [Clostridia bacterium]